MSLLHLHRFIVLTFIAPLLVACVGRGNSEQVTLRFAFPDTSAARTAAEAMQKSYTSIAPGVTLNLQPLPAETYSTSLADMLKRGNGPDLFTSIDSDVPLLQKEGAFLDLAPHGIKPGSQYSEIIAPWRKADQLLGLPQYAVPQVLFYNRALFDAAGEAYPNDSWTWDEWRAAAKRLTNRERGVYGTAAGSWDTIIWNNGGNVLNADRTKSLLDQPESFEAIQFVADMINVDGSTLLPKVAGGPDAAALFREGKLAMLPSPSSLMASLQQQPPVFAWDVAPLPTHTQRTTSLAVTALAANAKTAHPQAAAGFIGWAAGAEGLQTTTSAFPYAAPALPEVAPGSLLRGENAPTGGSFVLSALNYGRVPPYVIQTPTINKMVNDSLIPVWKGQSSAEAAYKDVTPKINAILQQG